MKVANIIKHAIDWYCRETSIVFDSQHHNDMKEPW